MINPIMMAEFHGPGIAQSRNGSFRLAPERASLAA